jgi:hypothetical protein
MIACLEGSFTCHRDSSAAFKILVMPSTDWIARSTMVFDLLSPVGLFSGMNSPPPAAARNFDTPRLRPMLARCRS